MSNTNFEITKSELFRHPKFGNLRVLTDEKGDAWFVGKVVAETLGYKNPAEALSDHVLSQDRKVLSFKVYSKTLLTKLWQNGDYRDKTLINESGLYSLILGSKLPQAIEFKHWVTSEVLPQIRRTGGYIPTHDGEGKPMTELEIMAMAQQIMQRTLAEHERRIAEQGETISVLAPKAAYCDEVLEAPDCMTMTQVAKEHGTTHPELTRLLHQQGVIFQQSGQWMLYADFGGHGLTRLRTHSHRDHSGSLHSHSYLVWSEKGRMFLDGILRRGLSPREALRQVEQGGATQAAKLVQLEITF